MSDIDTRDPMRVHMFHESCRLGKKDALTGSDSRLYAQCSTGYRLGLYFGRQEKSHLDRLEEKDQRRMNNLYDFLNK